MPVHDGTRAGAGSRGEEVPRDEREAISPHRRARPGNQGRMSKGWLIVVKSDPSGSLPMQSVFGRFRPRPKEV